MRNKFIFGTCGMVILLCGLVLPKPGSLTASARAGTGDHGGMMFQTSDQCIACHNGLVTSTGEDVSIASSWRATMMANSSRDPYWQASVKREISDHPIAQLEIEDECSKCHMPMARFTANSRGEKGRILAHLPIGSKTDSDAPLAADGVSCTLCHQITAQGLGTRESFVGGFKIDTVKAAGKRAIYGPFDVDNGRTTIMRSATGFTQTKATHIQQSELCATCHTLITKALGRSGEVVGELPEQVPYQEWLNSRYREEKSCQDCHMPVVSDPTPITSVLGEAREGLKRHDFRGGNFFMIQMLNRYRNELSVAALPSELEVSANKIRNHLENDTARVSIPDAAVRNGRLEVKVHVENLAGHKLPSAYPSRRAWLHLVVRDARGRILFESGGLTSTGLINGNDNDMDSTSYEPHYDTIREPGQVQIYESIMVDSENKVTTGLLSAVRYVKDNRLLPHGFDKETASAEIAVHGDAAPDRNFIGGFDDVQYEAGLRGAEGPFSVDAELLYQPIGYRWAQNLKPYDNFEARRFVSYYDAMAGGSGAVLAKASAIVR